MTITAESGAEMTVRPFYLPGPCPAWCDYGHDHLEWAAEDRNHRSADRDITLTAMNAILDHEEDGETVMSPRILSASLHQHYREAEPRVVVAHGEEVDAVAYLTLDEAGQLVQDLTALIEAARPGGTA